MSPTYSAREYIFRDWRLNFIIYTSFYSPLLILIHSMPRAKLLTSYIKAWLSGPDRIWPLKTSVREMRPSIVTTNESWPFKNVNYKLPEIYTHKRRMFEQKRKLKVFKTSFPSIESSFFVFPPYWILLPCQIWSIFITHLDLIVPANNVYIRHCEDQEHDTMELHDWL
jgi:hypothetical protein